MNLRSFFRATAVVVVMLAVSFNAQAQFSGALKSLKKSTESTVKEAVKEKVNDAKEGNISPSSSSQEETTESQPSENVTPAVNADALAQNYRYKVEIMNNTQFVIRGIIGRANGAPDDVTTIIKEEQETDLYPKKEARYSVYDDAVLVNFELKFRKETEIGVFQTVKIPLPVNVVPKEGALYRFELTGTDNTNLKLEVNTKTTAPPAPTVEKKIQQKSNDERYISIRNDLYDVFLMKGYARAAGSTDWGNPIFIGNIGARTFAVNIRIPLSISKNFDLRIVTSNAKEYVLSNCKAERDNTEFTIR